MSTPARDPGASDFPFKIGVLGLFGVAVGNWLVGNLAALLAGRVLHAGIGQALSALVRLPRYAKDPRLAWGPRLAERLPGPVVYWIATSIVVLVVLAVVGTGVAYTGRRRHVPADKRRRLGVATQARLASGREVAPLRTRRPVPGRFVLARWLRGYLSTEADSYRTRRGVRGAVAIFGPTQSGKTTGTITGVSAWAGPAVVSSVKADLLRQTIESRRRLGDVKVFDPLGVTGLGSCSWSPLRSARTLKGALAAAQMLARSGNDEGPSDRFWRGQAEQLIAAMLWTASNTEGQSMRNVVRWVLELDRPAADRAGTLSPLVRLLTDSPDPRVAMDARQVQGWLHGQWSTDPRTTSSVYATARNAIWPWADPDVAAASDGSEIDLDWLLAWNNTLYLCAPLGDETRIGVVFSVLLDELVTQAFERYNRTGEPLEPRFLVLLDEAANTYLPTLPRWAATVSGAGMQLVTIWQSKAQLDELYEREADSILTNHRSKLLYPSALSDLATIEYFAKLVGTEHVRADLDEQRWSGGTYQDSPRTPAAAVNLLGPNILRQLQVGDALLLHGQLPPIWIRASGSGR